MSVNKVILIGNLGNDPDIKYLPSGEPVANFSVATSETWNDKMSGDKREKTEWHRVVAFRKPAEIIGQFCKKGMKVYLEGKLQTRSWNDSSGQTRYITEIVTDTIQILTPKNTGEQSFNHQNNYSPAPQNQYGQNNQPNYPNYDNQYGKNYGQNNAPNYQNQAPSTPFSDRAPITPDRTDNNAFPSDSDIPF